MKLARESGVHQAALVLDGQEVLADVARLGMVALYFRAPGDRLGVARRKGSVWTWETITAEEDRARIQALFTALEHDVKSGFFELPGSLQASASTNGERP